MHRFDPTAAPPTLPDPLRAPSSDGVRVAVYDLGGAGPDLLLVHATGFCAGVWTPLAPALTRSNRVVAIDVRGHGRTPAPEAGMDWHGTAADVLAAVDALSLERPFGVGHSMGGASLLLAEQARPGTFRGMWLFEPIVFPTDLEGARSGSNPLAEGARRRRARFDSAEAAFDNFAAKPPLSALHPAALAAYVRDGFEEAEDGSVTLRCAPEVEARTYEMGARHAAWDHLDEVACPVVVARGRADGPGPSGFAPAIAQRLRRGRLEEHPSLGHFGPLEDPAAVAERIGAAVGAAS
jgi:pimeloyl-ACP methyl ester carboxylesterase